MNDKIKIGVVLSGCGNKDGAEIHESVMTLLAIHRHNADYQCFAPDVPQRHVLNFITDEEMPESRNVLIESARIARGAIKDLKEFDADSLDAVIFPGGLGVIKNLSTWITEGPDCSINEEVVRVVRSMADKKKPIGALCIAPVIMAKILGDVEVTVGQDVTTAETLEKMGAHHRKTTHGEITVDLKAKLVTTPCYMLDARVDQIADGAEKLVKAVIELIEE